MSTTERTLRDKIRRWQVPALAVLLGAVFGVSALARGRIGLGLAMAGIMFAYAAFLVLVSRASEPASGLRGDSADERRTQLQLRANAMTGNVLLTVVLAGFLVQIVRGADATVWALLGVVGGATYLASVFFYSQRGRG